VDGATFTYAAGGQRWSGTVVSEVEAYAAIEPALPPRFSDIAAGGAHTASVERRVAPAGAVLPLFRRSATELMAFAKDQAEHRRSYLLGLRPSPFSRAASAGPEQGTGHAAGHEHGSVPGNVPGHAPDDVWLDARTTGDLVHTIMEYDADLVARDLDAILDRELTSRVGADAAAALVPEVRARLRRLIADAHAHPAVARLAAGEGVERELPFTWCLDVDGDVAVVHGAMDLVARVDGAFEILDFKTHRLAPGEESRAAADYDLQRDLYAAALHELAGTPSVFSLFFPETGGEVRTALEATAVAAARERVCAALRAVAAGVIGRTSRADGPGEPASAPAPTGAGEEGA
jgi:hypothetical protein